MKTAELIINLARQKSALIATAESCTGGMIAAALTDIAGSSKVVDCGYVTYSNDAKIKMLGVDPTLIALRGAVSSEVVESMAEGAVQNLLPSLHGLAISVSGIAGPTGGIPEKPVGTVWFGLAYQHKEKVMTTSIKEQFSGNRTFIRRAATDRALAIILDKLESIES